MIEIVCASASGTNFEKEDTSSDHHSPFTRVIVCSWVKKTCENIHTDFEHNLMFVSKESKIHLALCLPQAIFTRVLVNIFVL